MALATRSKPTQHDRKRQAGHHRHSKEYLRSYWPYLPMLLIVGLGLLVNSAWSVHGVLGATSDFSSASLLSDTNVQRLQNGESALTISPQLTAAAQAKANDMVTSNYWAHNSPTGKTPWSFIDASGYQYRSAGENLAYGFSNADDSVAGWMNSPTHRANILDAAYQNVGFGVATSPDYQGQGPETVVVAEYGQPASSADNAVASAATGEKPTAGQPSGVLGAAISDSATSQPVSRIQLLAGSHATWSLLAVVVITGGAMALFLLRHGYRVHRLLTRGEMFVTRHPYFDIAIVFVITAGCVLTRSSGIIR